MSKNNLTCILILLVGFSIQEIQSQSLDLVRMEYTYFPQAKSDNSFHRFRGFVNYPIKLNENGAYLIPGAEYRNVNLMFKDDANFSTHELDRFQSFDANLGYTFKINSNWRFGSEIGIKLASNFITKEAITDDVIYTGAIFFINSIDREESVESSRMVLGLHYTTTSGVPLPLPIINYYKRINQDWSYSLGTPKSNLKYRINVKSDVQAFATLDGFFANLQKNFKVNPELENSEYAENLSMTIVLAGLGYEYKLTDYISFYIYGGHTLINNIRLRDGNRDRVYTINDSNSFYGRTGLKFNVL